MVEDSKPMLSIITVKTGQKVWHFGNAIWNAFPLMKITPSIHNTYTVHIPCSFTHPACSIPYTYMYPMLHVRSLIHTCIPCSMFNPLYIHVSHAPCSIPYTYMYPMLHVRSLIHTCIPCSMFDPLYIHVSHAPCSIPYTYMYPMLHVRSLIHTCIPCSMFDPLYIHVSHAPC